MSYLIENFPHPSPLVHPRDWNLIRLPVRRVDGQYFICVAEGMTRMYDDETLPDALKVKFAMILATPQPPLIPKRDLQNIHIYVNAHNPELNEIGWRVSDEYFCLVVNRQTLESLKGGTQNG